MIKSFKSKAAASIWNGNYVKSLPAHIQQVARRKLRMINNAQALNDLRVPPANRLEKLKGNLSGYHSIRINTQWRVVVKWHGNDAFDVEIIDYHD